MKALTDYPLRTCRTMHTCRLCDKKITHSQQYYDGGYGWRAHRGCAEIQQRQPLARRIQKLRRKGLLA